MQYAIPAITGNEKRGDYSRIGKEIGDLQEQNNFQVALPGSTDRGGYVFHMKTATIPADISVVDLPDGRFAIAVEAAKAAPGFRQARKSAEAVAFARKALDAIAPGIGCIGRLKWYSDSEWRTFLGLNVWAPRDPA